MTGFPSINACSRPVPAVPAVPAVPGSKAVMAVQRFPIGDQDDNWET